MTGSLRLMILTGLSVVPSPHAVSAAPDADPAAGKWYGTAGSPATQSAFVPGRCTLFP